MANDANDTAYKRLASGAIILIHGRTHGSNPAQILIGLFCSVFGGYLAGRLAKHEELVNGLLASFLCVGIAVYSSIAAKGSDPCPSKWFC